MPNTALSSVEIFRAGQHVGMDGTTYSFSDEDLAAIASGYDPDSFEAPIVIGHPATNAPAYGWVASVRAEGGRLVVDMKDVEPQFAEMVKARRFPKRSASFYTPTNPNNPTPGKWALRHVGFLGATPPAVAGLKEINFADGAAFAEFAEEQPEVDEKDKEIAALKESAAKQAEELADAKAQLADFAASQKKERHAANVAFAEAQFKAGKLTAKNRAGAVALLDVLNTLDAVNFAEGDTPGTLSPAEFVKSLIAESAVKVPLGEFAAGGQSASFASGMTDDEVVAAATRLAREKSISFADALDQLGGR